MIQVSVKRQGQLTNQASFPTMEEAQAWISHHEGLRSFGQPKQIIQQQIELEPAIIAEDGSILQEAKFETKEIELASEYELSVDDLTAKLEQERINAEALKFLAETDWMILRELDNGTPCPAEIRLQRQAARDKIVK